MDLQLRVPQYFVDAFPKSLRPAMPHPILAPPKPNPSQTAGPAPPLTPIPAPCPMFSVPTEQRCVHNHVQLSAWGGGGGCERPCWAVLAVGQDSGPTPGMCCQGHGHGHGAVGDEVRRRILGKTLKTPKMRHPHNGGVGRVRPNPGELSQGGGGGQTGPARGRHAVSQASEWRAPGPGGEGEGGDHYGGAPAFGTACHGEGLGLELPTPPKHPQPNGICNRQ